MSKFKNVPKYSLHKPSGQARVIIGGKHPTSANSARPKAATSMQPSSANSFTRSLDYQNRHPGLSHR